MNQKILSFVAENVTDDNESTLLDNSTTASKLNSRDIRKILSVPIKGNTPHYPSPVKILPTKHK